MPKKKPSLPSHAKKKPIKSYTHKGKKRANNPPVGLVTPAAELDIVRRQICQANSYFYSYRHLRAVA